MVGSWLKLLAFFDQLRKDAAMLGRKRLEEWQAMRKRDDTRKNEIMHMLETQQAEYGNVRRPAKAKPPARPARGRRSVHACAHRLRAGPQGKKKFHKK